MVAPLSFWSGCVSSSAGRHCRVRHCWANRERRSLRSTFPKSVMGSSVSTKRRSGCLKLAMRPWQNWRSCCEVERFAHHDRHPDPVAHLVVGHSERGHVAHRRVRPDHVFDLGGGELLPAPVDGVREAAGREQVALASAETMSPVRNQPGGRHAVAIAPPPVGHDHDLAAHPQLADRARPAPPHRWWGGRCGSRPRAAACPPRPTARAGDHPDRAR